MKGSQNNQALEIVRPRGDIVFAEYTIPFINIWKTKSAIAKTIWRQLWGVHTNGIKTISRGENNGKCLLTLSVTRMNLSSVFRVIIQSTRKLLGYISIGCFERTL